MPESIRTHSRNIRFGAAFILIAATILFAVFRTTEDPLIVYCAHDAMYAEAIVRAFAAETGIPVRVKFDTEATKSLGLVELIKKQRNAPLCDVFWNNELLGTMDLAAEGLLDSYKGTGYARISETFKDPEGRWTGFGARMRVYIVNTDNLPVADARAVDEYLEGDLARMAIANPLYGTTLTHYSILWKELGGAGLKAQDADWRRRGVKIVNGNASVKNLVAQGVCDLGWTDTDDAFLAITAGDPVKLLPVRVNGQAVCIPNTVSMIKGSSNPEAARRFIDYLLSEQCEIALANSASHQIPLGPVDDDQLPETVRDLRQYVAQGYPLGDLGDARAACLEWLNTN